jgi:hypothetical protein
VNTSRSASSFRPGLEALETRALPSGLALSLLGVHNQIAADTNQMNGLVQKMEDTQRQLTTDIRQQGRPAGSQQQVATPQISDDYKQASDLYGQIQSLSSQVGTLQGQEAQLERASFFLGDSFDRGVTMLLTVSAANPAVANFFHVPTAARPSDDIVNEANEVRNQSQDDSFPSIGHGVDDLTHQGGGLDDASTGAGVGRIGVDT